MNPSRIRVKMCGMTRSEDIAHAVHLGVDAIGLIFYPASKRHVTLEHARSLLCQVPPFVVTVAVLVDPEPGLVRELIRELPIHMLQFHGDESASFCQQFNKPYIKALPANSRTQIYTAAQEFINAAALLLDTPSDNAKGGTGIVFDWGVIPQRIPQPYILAGGLNELNVVDALNRCHPYAVDLCSGIEAAPGIKDHDKMNRFMNNVTTWRR